MSPPKKVLVICATGNQGRGVVKHCLEAGYTVSAYVRDPTTAAARQLAQSGATLVPGDVGDLDALRAATRGVDAVFLTEVKSGDSARDLQRSTNVIIAAEEAPTVSHVIVSTAITADEHDSDPQDHPMRQYWRNKRALETRVREAAESSAIQHWTIIRPGHYLQNLLQPIGSFIFPGFAQDRVLRVGWRPETQIPWMDAADVGIVTAAVIADPKRYSHRAIDLATEALTAQELAGRIGQALSFLSKEDVQVQVQHRSEEELDERIRAGDPIAPAQQWANGVRGEDVVASCRDELGPLATKLTSVDAFLAAHASRL
ncbi:NAD(P)-binding protein [Aspergillus pseudodeflectus]|uniref:NAD(P)-binding protein n=1 Tax=Aspergillus pseudodeflectus TaxID=176178 RepID=A0ABR4JD57_9EURO